MYIKKELDFKKMLDEEIEKLNAQELKTEEDEDYIHQHLEHYWLIKKLRDARK